MGKKGGKARGQTETTNSITLTDLSTVAGELGDKIESLLGDKELPQEAQPMALLRRSAARCTSDLLDKLGMEDYEAPAMGASQLVVLGPVPLELLHSLATLGILGAREHILVSHDRWKEIQQIFPDLKGLLLEHEEHTNTDTHTETETLLPQDGAEWDSDKTGALELDTAENGEAEAKRPSPPPPREQATRQRTTSASSATPARSSRRKAPPATLFNARNIFSFLIVLIAGSGLFYFLRSKTDIAMGAFEGGSEIRSALRQKQLENIPENLRPLPTETLYQNEFGLLRRLRPVLLQYEKGSLFLNEADEQFLKTVAQPASSSFQARILASNQLALYYVYRGRYSEAQKLLNDILLASPADVTTLINASIYGVITNHFEQARVYALSAQRLCRALDCWLPYALLGYIEGMSGNAVQAERLFEIALSHMDNGVVYGLWLKTLANGPAELKIKIPSIVRRSLWVDPDRLKDSPIRAPLFLHWIYTDAAEGYISALALFENEVGKAKAQYLRWTNNRHPFNAAPEPIAQTRQNLAGEKDLLGQLLYAYLLKEEGQWDLSSQILTRVIPQLSPKDYRGSWPWLMAGNLAEERGLLDQSILFYQNALSRHPRDVNAIYGLAMNLIQKGDFQGAQEKTAEALRLDPSFVPAILRTSRLDWHRRLQSE
jgi:tetratricopeptide (TPR) repeat protein